MPQPQTDLGTLVRRFFPGARVETDNFGTFTVYTGMGVADGEAIEVKATEMAMSGGAQVQAVVDLTPEEEVVVTVFEE